MSESSESYGEAHSESCEQDVSKVKLYERNLNKTKSSIPAGLGLKHEGLLLLTKDDKEYLLERGPNFSQKYGRDVVIRHNPDMTGWTFVRGGSAVSGATIRDFLDKARPDEKYHLLFNNCMDVKHNCEELIHYLSKDE